MADHGGHRKAAGHAIEPNTLRDQAVPSRAVVANRLSTETRASLERAVPRVSAWALSGYLVVVLVFAALVLPLVLHRAAWVEAEIVVLAWFVIWATLLSWLAYRGAVLDEVDDSRRAWGIRDRLKNVGNAWDVSAGTWPDAGEGIVGCLAIIVAVIVVLVIAWLFISFVLPVILIALLVLVRSLVGQVTRTADRTRGQLPGSILRGAFWAAVYTVPFAVGIWVLHAIL